MSLKSKQTTLKFRGPSNSHIFNTFFKNAHDDMFELFREIMAQNDETLKVNRILTNENTALKQKIVELESKVINLNTFFTSLTNPDGIKSQITTYYDNTITSYGGFPSYDMLIPQDQAQHNTIYGQLIPHVLSSSSKLYLYDTLADTTVFPDGIISISDTAGLIQPQEDPKLAIDGNDSTYWERQVLYSPTSNVVSELAEVTILLPQRIINTLDTNTIIVDPYPEFSLDILSVKVISVTGIETELLSEPLLNAPRQRFVFDSTPAIQVRVIFRQRHFELLGSHKVFSLGARNINVLNSRFSDTSKILTNFTLSTNNYKSIEAIYPEEVEGITYNIYYVGADNDIHQTGLMSSIPLGVNSIYIETILEGVSHPVLPSCTIDYTTWA